MIVINLLEKDFIETSIYEYITKHTKKHNIEKRDTIHCKTRIWRVTL